MHIREKVVTVMSKLFSVLTCGYENWNRISLWSLL